MDIHIRPRAAKPRVSPVRIARHTVLWQCNGGPLAVTPCAAYHCWVAVLLRQVA